MKNVAFIGIDTPTVFGILSKEREREKWRLLNRCSCVIGSEIDTIRNISPSTYSVGGCSRKDLSC
ncbi:hypothetical protein CARUB_v10002405mg [Capsella rubella]|uniref:Uncharacterized protein n=1 Tax=Capsella rubella TaxID=81985 RepID=R0FHT2_9BRAS|nr:hypothetical protein CARUB_v10002405mg [Capsella rubella]